MFKLVDENDPILHQKTTTMDLNNISFDIEEFSSNMIEFMIQTNGIGLASPQVGYSYRMFVMKIKNEEFVCINPSIITQSDNEEIAPEGCLSYPDLILKVRRPFQIEVQYTDQYKNIQTRIMEGLMARCFMHELQHLDGITFDTQVSKLSLSMAKDKRSKKRKKDRKK